MITARIRRPSRWPGSWNDLGGEPGEIRRRAHDHRRRPSKPGSRQAHPRPSWKLCHSLTREAVLAQATATSKRVVGREVRAWRSFIEAGAGPGRPEDWSSHRRRLPGPRRTGRLSRGPFTTTSPADLSRTSNPTSTSGRCRPPDDAIARQVRFGAGLPGDPRVILLATRAEPQLGRRGGGEGEAGEEAGVDPGDARDIGEVDPLDHVAIGIPSRTSTFWCWRSKSSFGSVRRTAANPRSLNGMWSPPRP